MKLGKRSQSVTGGAHGSGSRRRNGFVAERARVVIADVDAAAGEPAARALGTAAPLVAADVAARRRPSGW